VQSLGSPEVQGFAALVEHDGDDPAVASVPLDGCHRDGCSLSVDEADPVPAVEVFFRNHHPHI